MKKIEFGRKWPISAMKLSMAPSTIPEGTVSIGGLKNVSQVGIPDIGVASRARWLRYLLLKIVDILAFCR